MTFRTGIVVISTPLAHITRLAASTVSDLSLLSLHTHRFIGASGRELGSLGAVMAFWALADRGIRGCLDALQTDETGNTFVDLLSCSAVDRIWTFLTL